MTSSLKALPFPLPGADHAPALIGDPPESGSLSHGDLRQVLTAAVPALALPAKGLVWLLAPNGVPAAVGVLSALAAGHAVAPLDPGLGSERLAELAQRFRPELVLTPATTREPPVPGLVPAPLPGTGLVLWRRAGVGAGPEATAIHPELALLMATSGSTGNPRFARLSTAAIAANTAAIIQVLAIEPGDRALAHLPLWYSYGLSVLNSHLAAGGSVVMTARNFLDDGLWRLARTTAATALAGVPFHWESLLRLDLARLAVPSLRLFTQAGGRLAPDRVRRAAEMCAARGGRFHVMYGQTEAAPRITTLPAGQAVSRPGAVGPALPGGRLEILTEAGPTTEPGVVGEVIYYGANVMMGYATDRAGLAAGDQLGGRLATGDLGRLEADGTLVLTGRKGAFAKLLGLRLDLADVEAAAEAVAPVVAVQEGERLVLVTTEGDPERQRLLRAAVAAATGVHPGALVCRLVAAFPCLPNGKIDRRQLEGIAFGDQGLCPWTPPKADGPWNP
jgi:acyl-coenzyme A synthetase/AMP-(fatty) acid ligase